MSGFPEAGGSFLAPPRRRWRHTVLFTAALLIPISREWNFGGKSVNFGAADPLVAMVGLWLLWRLLTKGIRLPLGGLFLLNIAVVGVSTLYNQEIALNFQEPIGILVWLAKTPFLWLSFYLVVNLVDDRPGFLVFLRGWLFASVMVAGTGMYGSLSFQYTGVHNMFANWYRAQGTLNDCNAYAMYLALSQDYRFGHPCTDSIAEPRLRCNVFALLSRSILLSSPVRLQIGSGQGVPATPAATLPTPLRPCLSATPRSGCPALAALPSGHRQRPDPAQHVTEQPPVQMSLGQQQPVVAGMFDQTAAGLH